MSRDETPPGPACGEHPVQVLSVAANLQNTFADVSPDEAGGHRFCARGRYIRRDLRALADWLPRMEIPLRASSLLSLWADSGIIIAS